MNQILLAIWKKTAWKDKYGGGILSEVVGLVIMASLLMFREVEVPDLNPVM